MTAHLLTWTVFLPLVGAALALFFPKKLERGLFPFAIAVSLGVFGLCCSLYGGFNPGEAGFQFRERHAWIGSFNIEYSLGVDGVALVLILLTAFLTFVSLFYSSHTVRDRKKEFVVFVLALETGMIGTFAALDVFLFFVFWEATLLPMYLLIGVFGGPRRIYATVKFFLYTMAGSALMLAGLLILFWLHQRQAGFYSTSILDLYGLRLPAGLQVALFLTFLVAFAVKIPMFPFHTWLPDAHVEAPTLGSVLLAGILLKMGGFGLIRYALPLFPDAARAAAPWLGWLAVVAIIYGAYAAMAQQDIKRLVAYSSVSHMGFVVLGLSSLTVIGFQGAVFQMVAHGLSTGTLFLLVGMLYERRHTRMIVDYGGLARVTPRLAAAFVVVSLASIGLPGLCGFVGEFLVLTGSFRALVLGHPAWMAGIASLGVVLGAVYMLRLVEKVFFGEIRCEENRRLADLRWYEGLTLALPILAIIWLGLQPNVILTYVSPVSKQVVERVQPEADRR